MFCVKIVKVDLLSEFYDEDRKIMVIGEISSDVGAMHPWSNILTLLFGSILPPSVALLLLRLIERTDDHVKNSHMLGRSKERESQVSLTAVAIKASNAVTGSPNARRRFPNFSASDSI